MHAWPITIRALFRLVPIIDCWGKKRIHAYNEHTREHTVYLLFIILKTINKKRVCVCVCVRVVLYKKPHCWQTAGEKKKEKRAGFGQCAIRRFRQQSSLPISALICMIRFVSCKKYGHASCLSHILFVYLFFSALFTRCSSCHSTCIWLVYMCSCSWIDCAVIPHAATRVRTWLMFNVMALYVTSKLLWWVWVWLQVLSVSVLEWRLSVPGMFIVWLCFV